MKRSMCIIIMLVVISGLMIGCAGVNEQEKVTEPALEHYDYRNINWGMSIDEVKKSTSDSFIEEQPREDGITILIYEAELDDVSVILDYRFKNGSLEAIFCDSVDLKLNGTEANRQYWKWHERFTEKYGKPRKDNDLSPKGVAGITSLRTVWQDEKNQIELWFTEDDQPARFTFVIMDIEGEYKRETDRILYEAYGI